MPLRHITVASQLEALRKLGELTARSCTEWRVREAAIAITSSCRPPRGQSPDRQTSLCELQAIYHAVRDGNPWVKGMAEGVRYVADPIIRDFFVAPHKLLEACERGACGEDCDSQAALCAALAASIGFEVGMTAWGKPNNLLSPEKRDSFQHVFCTVVFPKPGQAGERQSLCLDPTVPTAEVGWKPPPGRTMTAWIHLDHFTQGRT